MINQGWDRVPVGSSGGVLKKLQSFTKCVNQIREYFQQPQLGKSHLRSGILYTWKRFSRPAHKVVIDSIILETMNKDRT